MPNAKDARLCWSPLASRRLAPARWSIENQRHTEALAERLAVIVLAGRVTRAVEGGKVSTDMTSTPV
jgi:hypothetical protein